MVMSSRMAATRALIELFEFILIFSNNEKVVFRSYSRMQVKSLSRSSYHRKLKKFERHGLLKKSKTITGHVFTITNKAKFLRRKAITKRARTDGFSTLIIFDIPEEKHNARDTLRRYLVRSGYTQIRESCFLSPFQISGDLTDLIEELKINNNVTVFSAKMNLF